MPGLDQQVVRGIAEARQNEHRDVGSEVGPTFRALEVDRGARDLNVTSPLTGTGNRRVVGDGVARHPGVASQVGRLARSRRSSLKTIDVPRWANARPSFERK